MSLDNLLRLGLIEIPFNITYGDDTIYELVRKTDSYIQIIPLYNFLKNKITHKTLSHV